MRIPGGGHGAAACERRLRSARFAVRMLKFASSPVVFQHSGAKKTRALARAFLLRLCPKGGLSRAPPVVMLVLQIFLRGHWIVKHFISRADIKAPVDRSVQEIHNGARHYLVVLAPLVSHLHEASPFSGSDSSAPSWRSQKAILSTCTSLSFDVRRATYSAGFRMLATRGRHGAKS